MERGDTDAAQRMVDEAAAPELIREAIAPENAGDIGVYYIKKEQAFRSVQGCNSPDSVRRHSLLPMVLYTGFPKKSSVRRRHMERSTPAS